MISRTSRRSISRSSLRFWSRSCPRGITGTSTPQAFSVSDDCRVDVRVAPLTRRRFLEARGFDDADVDRHALVRQGQGDAIPGIVESPPRIVGDVLASRPKKR